MDADLPRRLARAGLGRAQADAYVALLALGGAGAAEVARQARMPRTSAYGALAALAAAGLATVTCRGKRRSFLPARPQALLELPRRQETELRALVGELAGLAPRSRGKPRISLHEGHQGIIHVNELLLAAKGRAYRYIGSAREMGEAMGEDYLRDYVRRRVARGVRVRAIRVRGNEVPLPCLGDGERWLREVRHLRRGVASDLVSLYLWDDKVGIISTLQEGYGLVIESRELYALADLIWQVLWEVAEPARTG